MRPHLVDLALACFGAFPGRRLPDKCAGLIKSSNRWLSNGGWASSASASSRLRFADGHDGDNRTHEGDDLEPRIQQMVTDLMATARLSDFMDFATNPHADWSTIDPIAPSLPLT